ncbi:IclR family transcriptional regulator [Alicyclobacillus sp. SO9]|uniref:IclR family transcriptional regulator n=1 Tax=Alicyclobacillus sp. SO9 TaxID=2665646 RepID=UPI0018E74B25|nr:IclR family transcriptional regulator [Alicyclobacillus sp. SO9]QQE77577.1 IclR family transcriptional regulator [Alicyclobacillus sp. SO9]
MPAAYGTAVLKAVSILNFLSTVDKPQKLKDICQTTGLNKATAFKLLETLQSVGYVEKTDDVGYRLGLGLVRIAGAALHSVNTVRLIEPYVKELNMRTGETVHFGVAERNEVVYVTKLESKQAVRMYSKVGNTAPMYCTGIGKAILSTYGEVDLAEYLASVSLRKITNQTLTDEHQLRRELREVREQGYSIDNGEHEPEVRCIAVPLVANGKTYGAVSVSVPSYRMDDAATERHLADLKWCQVKILSDLRLLS